MTDEQKAELNALIAERDHARREFRQWYERAKSTRRPEDFELCKLHYQNCTLLFLEIMTLYDDERAVKTWSGLARAVDNLEVAAKGEPAHGGVTEEVFLEADPLESFNPAPPTEDPVQAVEAAPVAVPQPVGFAHGVACRKVAHVGNAEMHAPDHDGPFIKDGKVMCGRCHASLNF